MKSEQPDPLVRTQGPAPISIEAVNPPEFKKSGAVIPIVLLLLTMLTTLIAGWLFHIQFLAASQEGYVPTFSSVIEHPSELLLGVPFAVTILFILLAHEMGHYFACRIYGIRATLPYVIPAPPLIVPFGTFGAVIKIKSLFRDRQQLFDVGIAGPLAGFVFIIPALIIGLRNSNEFVMFEGMGPTLQFGEPLLFQLVASMFFSGDVYSINLHPIGWAAWFGMLATSLNLLPVGQLDGGHVVYAIYGQKGHKVISYVTFVGLVLLSLYSWPMLGYLLFALVLLFLRFRHPRPYLEIPSLGRKRLVVAFIGLVIFALTFIPVPVRLVEETAQIMVVQ